MKQYEAKEFDAVASYEVDHWVVQTIGENWYAVSAPTFTEAVEKMKKQLHLDAFMTEQGNGSKAKSPSDVNLMWERAWYWEPRSSRNPEEDRNKRFRLRLEEEWGKGWKAAS